MSGIVPLLDRVAEMTSAIDMLAPIDRSNVPVASGTRNASARQPVNTAGSIRTSLNEVQLRNTLPCVIVNTIMNSAHR